MPDIPTSYSGYVPRYLISINGKPISNAINVVSVTVICEAGKAGSAEVVLLDGDPLGKTFEISSSGHFDPGVELCIAAGYDNDTAEIFKGTISGQTLKAGEGGYPQLAVNARSAADRSLDADASKPAVLSLTYGASLLSFEGSLSKQGKKTVITGEISISGYSRLKPGDVIAIGGVGERFSGNAVVTSIKHVLSAEGWSTAARFKSSYTGISLAAGGMN